jgi:UDP-N-acetylmuramoylalanine--D-glutamate ligase
MTDRRAEKRDTSPKILVVGAGKSGVAAANFLAARDEHVVLTDGKEKPDLPYELDSRVTTAFARDDDALLDGVVTVVLSPGVPLVSSLLIRAAMRAIPIISEIELAYRFAKGTIIAITGSNGKSTTTALIGEILRVAGHQPIVAGNFGEPFIKSLDLSRPRTYVLELSSFQLETVDTFRADVALLLNITPDHMDRYTHLDDYAAAKYRIFRNQTSSDTAIVNASERRELARDSTPRIWRFSAAQRVDEGAFLDGDALVLRAGGEERRIPRAALKLEGIANVENALAAWLAARAVGVDDVDVQIAFGTFAGLPHRMVVVRERDGVKWINDSKGTNVDATLKSLERQRQGRRVSSDAQSRRRQNARRDHHRRRRRKNRQSARRRGEDRSRRRHGHRRSLDRRKREAGRERAALTRVRELRSVPELRAQGRAL